MHTSRGILVVPEVTHQSGVLRGGDAMAETIGAKIEGGPHRFRSDSLPGVRHGTQAVPGCVGEDILEPVRRSALLISADTEGDYSIVRIFHRSFGYGLRGFTPNCRKESKTQ